MLKIILRDDNEGEEYGEAEKRLRRQAKKIDEHRGKRKGHVRDVERMMLMNEEGLTKGMLQRMMLMNEEGTWKGGQRMSNIEARVEEA